MSDNAVFFDPTRRRWWWIKRVGTLLGLFAVVTVSVWLVSLFAAPLPGLQGITAPSAADLKRSLGRAIRLPRHQTRLQQYLLKKDRERLLTLIERDRKAHARRAALPPIHGGSIVAAFYAPWQETGIHSLEANAKVMTHLMPAWVHLQQDGRSLDFRDWDPSVTPLTNRVVDVARSNNLNIVPVFSNAQMSNFDAQRLHVFLSDPRLQDGVIRQLLRWVQVNRFQGINVDFENLADGDGPLYVAFLRRLRAAFGPALIVSADLEPSRPLNWRAVSSICDFVVVMAYNEHGETSKPGPIASIDWYRRTVLQRAVREVPADKLVIGLANYGFDWMEGRDWADSLTYQNAIVLARKYRPTEKPEQIVDFDDKALNPTFSYEDDDGKQHEVWFLDAVTAANQWMIAQNYAPRGAAMWVLGSADPSIWTFLNRTVLNRPFHADVLRTVKYPPTDVDFEGEGEIAHVEGNPTDGSRSLEIDPKTGLVLDEAYLRFPQPTVILRTGYRPKWIALTIDDGPSVPYTAQILDELKQLNVKATFFLIGENAERYPNLVRRIWSDGHEIGNHSFTHPNTGTISPQQARLELTATQRVIQTLLGRSTLLFRPPYNADAEPTTVEEVTPIRIASQLNYITVLEFIDSQDWNIDTYVRNPDGTLRRRNETDMLKTVLDQIERERGSNILLHDGGGNRSATVKLIPVLVNELRARGYTFVTVSQLLGVNRDDINPPVQNADTLMMASDRVVFEAIYLWEVFLRITFITAIILGAGRVLFITSLAILERYRERRKKFDDAFQPPVTVVIAAFNEEKVIARTIRAVLATRYEQLDIVVVDDGSKDNTSAEVVRAFGDNPRVRLLWQENGGKASALNRGIAEASGDIIIALDADTIFARNTINKLVRHFADPLVGAVAGNVKVGNRVNPLTYWQSIEYVTSQNLDRRAYALINSVSVVPGAVGAWRREAVLQAGGYSTDTMAEDMDLTWRIRRIGWRVDNESEAVGYTEVPESFGALFRQRFRWAFGTLQCLWKHRRALGRYGWFGRVMIPSLWLFQIFFQTLSPLIDVEILWTLGKVGNAWMMRGYLVHDWQPLPQAMTSLYLIGFMYAFFFVIELIGAVVAYRLDREDSRVLVWLFWQRFLYRQLMYAVVLKSLKTAISGIRAGWGKLDRKGTVELMPDTPELRPTGLQP